jgi:hypothetical protein
VLLWWCACDRDAPPQQARRSEQAGDLDRLGGEREAVDGLGVWVQQRHAGRDRERVAREQAGECGRRGCERQDARGPPGQPDGDRREGDGRASEADTGPGAFVEVAGGERAVDAGADRAGEDDEVAPEFGESHLTITSPSMSWLCSVQT